MKNKLMSVVATAAAIAFITAPVTSTIAQAKSAKVACYGVNSCKGKSSCKGEGNSCKGKNDCKGKGMMMKTKKQCEKLGGSLTPPTDSAAPAEAPKS